MLSKLSFLRSIRWKLFLYFMGAMLLAAASIMLLFGPPPPISPPLRQKGEVRAAFLQGGLCVLIISSGAAFLLSLNFLRPLLKMRKVSEKLACGDFSTRIGLNSNDELGDLARAFDSMASRLEENIEGRIRLAGDISHELNSPLAAIRVNIEALLDGVTDIRNEEEREKALSSMLYQTKRISVLVEDLLELAKFEARAVKMSMAPFAASEPVKRVIESVSPTAAKKRITVDHDIRDEELRVLGDKTRITQVMQNLVNNAIQHNSEGVHVRVSVKREAGSVRFSVADDGIGIPAHELENVFKRFHRLDKRAQTPPGSGLGLAIASGIIGAHGSRISVESPGKGTRFFFSLPTV
ncbi:MAG: HAMP domain-containing histidine kinase [Armatimonadetes bacterium]|nr:HAMP domain-containing histidine kinase [Armatimonadota bacterium]